MILVTFLCCCVFTSHLWLHDPYMPVMMPWQQHIIYHTGIVCIFPCTLYGYNTWRICYKLTRRYMHICVYMLYTYTCMYVLMYINVCIATYVCIHTLSCYKCMIYQTDTVLCDNQINRSWYDYHYFYYIQSSNYYIILRYTKIN